MPGATATVHQRANERLACVVTDARGDFQVTALHPGRYTVRVELTELSRLRAQGRGAELVERVSVGTIALEVGGSVRPSPSKPPART